jgi:predicted DNA-binding transcriptional regulator AlpA
MTTERPGSHLSRLLTVQELADLLQIPAKTIYTWRYRRIGPPAVPMGKYLRFRRGRCGVARGARGCFAAWNAEEVTTRV